MTILRILHIGQIASAMLPPGFQRPEDDGFPAAERTAKTLAVARARPQLLMSPRPARRPPYRLAQRAPDTIIYPDHQIHRPPFNAAAAIVIAIQHPARRGRRGGNGGENASSGAPCQFGRQYRRSSSIQGNSSLCARRRAKVDLPEPLVPTTLIFISVSPGYQTLPGDTLGSSFGLPSPRSCRASECRFTWRWRFLGLLQYLPCIEE